MQIFTRNPRPQGTLPKATRTGWSTPVRVEESQMVNGRAPLAAWRLSPSAPLSRKNIIGPPSYGAREYAVSGEARCVRPPFCHRSMSVRHGKAAVLPSAHEEPECEEQPRCHAFTVLWSVDGGYSSYTLAMWRRREGEKGEERARSKNDGEESSSPSLVLRLLTRRRSRAGR